jgi:catechol 2,3-dioxygenase-like lactoylglutathione lyase family enzyme
MLGKARAFSSFAVKDLEAARKFYGQTLGLQTSEVPGMKGLLQLNLPGSVNVMVYPKPDHAAATFTVLNFPVENLERTVSALGERGVRFEIYRDGPVKTDERGISTGPGPRIAWFRDPSGNILSVLEETG